MFAANALPIEVVGLIEDIGTTIVNGRRPCATDGASC